MRTLFNFPAAETRIRAEIEALVDAFRLELLTHLQTQCGPCPALAPSSPAATETEFLTCHIAPFTHHCTGAEQFVVGPVQFPAAPPSPSAPKTEPSNPRPSNRKGESPCT